MITFGGGSLRSREHGMRAADDGGRVAFVLIACVVSVCTRPIGGRYRQRSRGGQRAATAGTKAGGADGRVGRSVFLISLPDRVAAVVRGSGACLTKVEMCTSRRHRARLMNLLKICDFIERIERCLSRCTPVLSGFIHNRAGWIWVRLARGAETAGGPGVWCQPPAIPSRALLPAVPPHLERVTTRRRTLIAPRSSSGGLRDDADVGGQTRSCRSTRRHVGDRAGLLRGSGTSKSALCRFGSNFSPSGSTRCSPCCSNVLRSIVLVIVTPSCSIFSCSFSAIASSGTESAARPRLSATSRSDLANLPTANLCAFSTSMFARRRAFSASAAHGGPARACSRPSPPAPRPWPAATRPWPRRRRSSIRGGAIRGSARAVVHDSRLRLTFRLWLLVALRRRAAALRGRGAKGDRATRARGVRRGASRGAPSARSRRPGARAPAWISSGEGRASRASEHVDVVDVLRNVGVFFHQS